jgi:hypothetical protein
MSRKTKSNLATATVILVLIDVVPGILNRPWQHLVVTVGAFIATVLAARAIRRDKVTN